MLTPYLPYPPSSGGQVRSYNLIKNLGRKHKIVLVALIKNEEEEKYVKNLQKYCEKIYVCKRSESPWTPKNILKSIFGRFPFLVVRNFSPEAKNIVHRLLKEEAFDLIHAETFYIMPHIPQTTIPILLVEQTIEYMVYQHFADNLKYSFLKPLFYFDIVKLKYWETAFWQKADLVGAMSETDKKKMIGQLGDLKVEIIPNAAGEDLADIYQDDKNTDHPTFLYQGNFFWLQNIEAATLLATKIFPQLKREIPNSICLIAGQKAHQKIGALQKFGVKIVDIPPSDTQTVKDMYKKATIFLAPIKGPGGTRLKILGAMAAGVPVISSPTGVSGLKIIDGQHVLIARQTDDFISLSKKILENKTLYANIRHNAKRLVEEEYNWAKIAEKLENIYMKMKEMRHENSH